MKVILSHPTGNENVRAVAMGMRNAGILKNYHTGIATFSGDIIDRLSSFSIFSHLNRRQLNSQLKEFTVTSPTFEWCRLISLKLGFSKLTKHEKGYFSVDAIYKNLDKTVAKRLNINKYNSVDLVYAFEDGALFSFLAAKQNNLKCFYDLPIGYWRTAKKYLEMERIIWPEWAETITNFKDSPEKLLRKDEEIRLSDKIFVASSFTAKTLKNFPGRLPPIAIIPYGFPKTKDGREYRKINNKLKVLFVGGLSQRKGIANLFSAVEYLEKNIELTVIGKKSTHNCEALNLALAKHNWIPSLPHKDILLIMQNHDVLVFPSLFEGFGLVISEAMSQGTPVITTERTAGPDLILDGENGWLIEAGSTDALIAALEKLLMKPEQIFEAGKAAANTARNRPWQVYGQELSNAIVS